MPNKTRKPAEFFGVFIHKRFGYKQGQNQVITKWSLMDKSSKNSAGDYYYLAFTRKHFLGKHTFGCE